MPKLENIGACLVKPDAVELGVAEYILAHIAHALAIKKAGEMTLVSVIDKLPFEKVPALYPKLDADGYEIVRDYLCAGTCVLAFYKGNGVGKELLAMKGKRMGDWSLDELDGSIGWKEGIRCAMPLPGTTKEYQPIVERIRARRLGQPSRFTDDEFRVYCRNLIHTPDDDQELLGLLSLLSKEERRNVWH